MSRILIIVILFVLALPFLILFGFFHVASAGFEGMGVSPVWIPVLFIAMGVGSLVNIPLGKQKLVEVQENSFFGFIRRKKLKAQGMAINVGGAVVPVLLSLYLLTKTPLEPVLFAVMCMIVLCFLMARVIPGVGIALPLFAPPIFSVIAGLILVPQNPAGAAFIAGTFGVLIGADLLHLGGAMRNGGVFSIGGAGVFDGIFLMGIFAAFLAGVL